MLHPVLRSFLISLLPAFVLGLAGCPAGDDDTVVGDDDDSGDAGPYDLSFDLSGYAAHNGNAFRVVVVHSGMAGDPVAEADGTITGGAFSQSWTDVLENGMEYDVNYYADFNANGQCDPPSDDHVWTIHMDAVTGDREVIITSHTTDWVDVCDTLN
jgi:hypothetical protein